MSLLRVFLLGSVLCCLCACSGGNNNHNDNNGGGGGGVTALTGQIIDSAVSGIRYTTATRSRVIDTEGKFEYLEGETVQFYLGDLLLGDARGAAVISLFDLVDGVTPVVGNALKKAIRDWRRGPNFSTVINLATLLQTLDSDGNPDNGIDISSDVAALFTANSVNFNQHWQDFKNDHGFKQVLAEAKARSLLDGARQIQKPWLAIAHLYASLGIDSDLRAVSGRSTDSDGDGSPDFISSYGFDAEGKLVYAEYDYDADGAPEIIISYTYDTAGNVLREQLYSNVMSSYDFIDYSYDANGNLIRSEFDLGGDGVAVDIWSGTYDADSNLIRSESDLLGDGIPENISVYTYDADGNLLRSEDYYRDDDTPGQIYTYAYDVDGNRIRTEWDRDGDGTADQIWSDTYDVEGNLIRAEQDDDGDGIAESIWSSTYDVAGNLIRLQEHGSAWSLWMISIYTYDADGNRLREEVDFGADGTPDAISTYAYDAHGNQIRVENDRDADGAADYIVVTFYDADGNRIRVEYDYDGDSTVDNTTTFTITYDANVDGWWSAFNGWMTDR